MFKSFQLRHRLQLLAVVGCLSWGGYQLTSAAFAETGLPVAQLVASTDQDLETSYKSLPPGVARAVQSVVATRQVSVNPDQASVASGVIINGQQIVTAGHSVEGVRGLACSNTSVIAAGMLTNAAASSDRVTHASVDYDTSNDIAVLTIEASDNFRDLPDIAIASRIPEKGDRVYFINFQPTSDGRIRSPMTQVSSQADRDVSKPAVFGGIVLGNSKHGIDIATGNGVSYGIGVPDSLIRKGASGGAIVNEAGQLVGISVSSESLLADHTAASIVKQYQVPLKAIGRYQIAHMQLIGPAAIKNLQSATVSCASSQD